MCYISVPLRGCPRPLYVVHMIKQKKTKKKNKMKKHVLWYIDGIIIYSYIIIHYIIWNNKLYRKYMMWQWWKNKENDMEKLLVLFCDHKWWQKLDWRNHKWLQRFTFHSYISVLSSTRFVKVWWSFKHVVIYENIKKAIKLENLS